MNDQGTKKSKNSVGDAVISIIRVWQFGHVARKAVLAVGLVLFAMVQSRMCVGARPNVILIMTDDQGYGDVGIHGNTMLKTPNLDTLARQGVRMTDFHVDPTCAETRAALMTGRYSCRTGVWHTINGRSILREDELTMADVFASNGYATGIFGKWHLGDNYPFLPQHRGFQETLIHGGGGVTQTPDAWGNDYYDDTYFRNGSPEQQAGYCTDVFFDATLDFIQRHRNQPFFAYLPTNAAHGPYRCPQEYAKPYLDQGVEKTMATFYGMIANIDENVGRLREKLAEWDLEENTILIFSTDNGTARGMLKPNAIGKGFKWIGFNGGLRGTKGSNLEGGHRVPFFVHWPAGGVTGGREVDTLTAQFDLLPTFVDLCELKMPRAVEFDGQSLKQLWQESDNETDLENRTLIVHSQRMENPKKWNRCEVMKQNWRLVNGKYLHDLDVDRSQENDVADKYPEVVQELRASYDQWWDSVSTRFDEYVRIPLGADEAPTVELTCHDWHATKGEVPWNQGKIRANPLANGYWAIEVRKAGKYEFILRARPAGVKYEFPAGEARLKLGEQDQTVTVELGQQSISLIADLPAGPALLQTWISDTDGKERGAYFVEVKRR